MENGSRFYFGQDRLLYSAQNLYLFVVSKKVQTNNLRCNSCLHSVLRSLKKTEFWPNKVRRPEYSAKRQCSSLPSVLLYSVFPQTPALKKAFPSTFSYQLGA